MDYKELIAEALKARENSYSIYSNFSVGAALLCADGDIYLGANIENGSYGATICAERTAIFKAVLDGKRKFEAIAIVGGKSSEGDMVYAYPCGICRQVMTEFFDKNTKIIVAKNIDDYKIFDFDELMPYGFNLD